VRTVTVRAHAKINLALRVLGIRPDGYHELRTIFQTIGLHDIVRCTERPGPFAIECSTAGVPLDSSNLIWKAAAALWRALRRPGEPAGVLVRLEKRIPIEAGLGGGSADAAAALIALARLWRVDARPEQLADVGAAVGADVPFFLWGGTALGLGRGDEIYPLADRPPRWVVLLVPGFGVSSRDAFTWYDADGARGLHARAGSGHEPSMWPAPRVQMVNDLEAPVSLRHPEIAKMAAALKRVGAEMAAMSGSGSTVFGLFRRQRDATAATRALEGSPWRVFTVASLGRGEYLRQTRPRVASVKGASAAGSGPQSSKKR